MQNVIKKKAVDATAARTPLDCVVVFEMPDWPDGSQVAICKAGAIHNVQPGNWYRTSPMSFPEASKRAAHYANVARKTAVVEATRHVLDRYVEIPITEEMTAYIYSRPTPRGVTSRWINQIRDNPGVN